MFISFLKFFRGDRCILLPFLAMLMLPACATSTQGRLQLTAPDAVSEVYSGMDVELSLVTAGDGEACHDEACELDRQFDQQVARVGEGLSRAAHVLLDGQQVAVPEFKFEVAEKNKLATASSDEGRIVVMRGLQSLQLDDAGLAFLLAREMGHVIGRHHDENTGTRILISVLAGVLFPASGLFSASSAATQATATSSVFSTTALSTAAASTATSVFGSMLVMDNMRPKQISESDYIAAHLVEQAGWPLDAVSTALAAAPVPEGEDAWAREYRESRSRITAWVADAMATRLALQSETGENAAMQAAGGAQSNAGRGLTAAAAAAADPEPVPASMALAAAQPIFSGPELPQAPVPAQDQAVSASNQAAPAPQTAVAANAFPEAEAAPATPATAGSGVPELAGDPSGPPADTPGAMAQTDPDVIPETAPEAMAALAGTGFDPATEAQPDQVLEPVASIMAQLTPRLKKTAGPGRKAMPGNKKAGAKRLAARQPKKASTAVRAAANKPRGKPAPQRTLAQARTAPGNANGFVSRIKPATRPHRSTAHVKHQAATPKL